MRHNETVPVSVLVPVRNEEDNIGPCLRSVQWADEIFVVDSHSIDNTARIFKEASGPSHTVPGLCQVLSEKGVAIELHVTKGAIPLGARYSFVSHGEWEWPPKIGFSPQMRRELFRKADSVDIIHCHGMWLMQNIYAGEAARKGDCKLIISPRGTFAPWALRRHRWRKRIAWIIGQGACLRQAKCFHATSEAEYIEIRRMGYRTPVSIVPNGVSIPKMAQETGRQDKPRRELLFLGRLHPVKGVDLLLKSWKRIEQSFPEWDLKVFGPGCDKYLSQTKNLAQKLEVQRAYFCGPTYGKEKQKVFESAELYILPTQTENFGLTVAEALAHGVPVIVTKGAPWEGVVERKCGWWIDRSVQAVADALKIALSRSPGELHEMGLRGRKWMEDDFSWSRIGDMMFETYEWLVKGAKRPDCVMLD
jgi:glycosyltransferase involved in cell wall biosynthesis